MKSKEEIKNWLENQEWFEKVKTFMSEMDIKYIFDNVYNTETIDKIFYCMPKSMKIKYDWNTISNKFRKWYWDKKDENKNDNVSINKCKVSVCQFKRNFDSIFERGIMIFAEDDRSVIIDSKGKIVDNIYKYILSFDEGAFVTELN